MDNALEFNFLSLFLSIITALLLGLYIIYVVYIRPYSVLKNLGIPGPRPLPIIGNLHQFYSYLDAKPINKLSGKYGKVFGIYEGTKPIVVVTDLDLLKQIFIKDFQHFTDRRSLELFGKCMEGNVSDLKGQKWKEVRNIMTPAFSTGKMKKIFQIIIDCSHFLMEELKGIEEQNKVIDVKNYFSAFVVDAIARSAFGIELNSMKDPTNPFVIHANKIANRNFYSLATFVEVLAPCLIPLMKLFGVSILPRDSQDFLMANLRNVIQMRKQQGGEEKDFLQILLNTQKNISTPLPIEGDQELNDKLKSTDFHYEKKHLTDEEILPQSIIFYLGGSETTSTTLSFCCYLLGNHPVWQDKMAEEIQQTLKNQDDIFYEDIAKLKILDMVVMETLRIYTPAPMLFRQCTMDYNMNGLKIPKGTIISIPIRAIHDNDEIWPNSQIFDPERFSPSNNSDRHPMSFLTFGIGPRNCIGMRFALLEVKLMLAKLIKNFKIILASNEKPQLIISSIGTVIAKNGIWIRLEKR